MPKHIGDYEIERTLGEGTFGKVKQGRHVKNGNKVAIKVLDKNKIQKENMGSQVKREICIMKLIKHPHVVQVYEVLASKAKIFIVLELVTGGELFDKIVENNRLDEDTARIYFQQLCVGTDFCHRKGVCHRDLKPENLLLDDQGNLKISDFGLSAFFDQENGQNLLHTTCGTPNYVAPEVIADKGYDGAKADTWSIGVILYVFLAGYLPFDEQTLTALFRKIEKAEFVYPNWITEDAKDLISKILVPNPNDRYTIAQIAGHPWWKKGGPYVNIAEELGKPSDAQSKVNPTAAVVNNKQMETAVQQIKGEKEEPAQVVQTSHNNSVSSANGMVVDQQFPRNGVNNVQQMSNQSNTFQNNGRNMQPMQMTPMGMGNNMQQNPGFGGVPVFRRPSESSGFNQQQDYQQQHVGMNNMNSYNNYNQNNMYKNNGQMQGNQFGMQNQQNYMQPQQPMFQQQSQQMQQQQPELPLTNAFEILDLASGGPLSSIVESDRKKNLYLTRMSPKDTLNIVSASLRAIQGYIGAQNYNDGLKLVTEFNMGRGRVKVKVSIKLAAQHPQMLYLVVLKRAGGDLLSFEQVCHSLEPLSEFLYRTG